MKTAGWRYIAWAGRAQRYVRVRKENPHPCRLAQSQTTHAFHHHHHHLLPRNSALSSRLTARGRKCETNSGMNSCTKPRRRHHCSQKRSTSSLRILRRAQVLSTCSSPSMSMSDGGGRRHWSGGGPKLFTGVPARQCVCLVGDTTVDRQWEESKVTS